MKYLIKFIIIFFILSLILSVGIFNNNKWDESGQSIGVLYPHKPASVEKVQKEDADYSINNDKHSKAVYETKSDDTEFESFILDVKPDFENINVNYPGNYIDKALSLGHIIRWNPDTFPLRVYIENNPELPDYFYKEVKKAFEDWKKASGNFFAFIYVEPEDYADIRCKFLRNFDREIKNNGMTSGVSSFKISNNLIKYSEIKFAVYDTNNKYIKPKKFHSTAKHEIGHSLGINGHSTNSDDIMYPVLQNSRSNISKGDVNTLRLLYSIVPDISNKEFSEEAKSKMAKSADILGNFESRIARELDYTKHDIELSSESKYKVFRIAELYFVQKNYEKAIENYKKLLPKISNTKSKAFIYYKIALSYKNLNKNDESLNYALTAYNLSNDSEMTPLIAQIYYENGDYEQAKNFANSILRRYPKTYNMYSILAKIYDQEKNYDEIVILGKKAKQYFPENPPVTVTFK